ncbi:hypothetical protein [Pontibacter mangrovi]|uniref:Uncharacterized protein n=1 Tax=Pontibacter mangrovi TaxID=2589816 RepID=A0A501W156_9BACT|nr:hypothetical protein [Pontibacter mangrovi]TPE43018.1 hypothetical protein FJM65_15335 [Pontibacter mangrovi]
MKAKQSIPISIGIVLLNNLIGHYYGPSGITFTPAVIIAVTIITGHFTFGLKPYMKTILIIWLIALNDIGIKLYSDGMHDNVGQSLVLLYLLIGAIPAFGLLVWSIVKDKNEVMLNKMISIVLFPVLLMLHIYLFQELGLGRYY